MDDGKKEKGLNSSTIGLMIGVALFFDAIQALLTPILIGYLVPVVSYPTFWLWFKIHGINFFSMKRAPTLGIGAIMEIIPGISVVPAFTFTVARIALDSKFKAESTDAILGRVAQRYAKSKDTPQTPGPITETSRYSADLRPQFSGPRLVDSVVPARPESIPQRVPLASSIGRRAVEALAPQDVDVARVGQRPEAEFRFLRPGDEHVTESMTGDNIRQVLAPNQRVIVAGKNTAMSLEDYHDYLYVDGINVEESMRGQGLATKFYDEAMKLAEKEGKKGVISAKRNLRHEATKRIWDKFEREGRVEKIKIEGDEYNLLKPKPKSEV